MAVTREFELVLSVIETGPYIRHGLGRTEGDFIRRNAGSAGDG